MPRFGGPGRPPKVKVTPIGPIVPVAASPLPESDDASSTTTETMNTKSEPTGINNINSTSTNNATTTTTTNNNKSSSATSDVVVDHSYTAPQWLLQEKQSPKFFSIPIPPVSTEMFQAVQRLMGTRGGGASGVVADGGDVGDGTTASTSSTTSTIVASRQARLQTHLALDKRRQLEQDHKTQSKKVLLQKEKLAHAMTRKEQGMEEWRREKQVEFDASLQKLETQLWSEEMAKFEQQQEEMKKEIQLQFEQDYEAEQSRKRKQASLDTNHDKDSTADKNSIADTAESGIGETMEEGEEEEQGIEQEPKSKQVKTESPKKELVSEQIQKKIETCHAKLDSLQEKKSEMVWLLKQVIKADAKRKAELLKLKKAAPALGTMPATAASQSNIS